MVFKRLQDSQDSLYLQAMQLYQTSFPLHEQRKPDAQRAILQEPDYQFNLLMEEDHLLGELLCWERPNFIYVEHLCILPQLRGQHCGSPGAGAAWAKRKAGHSGDRPAHR